ncbi:XRE family transcriptional regulator [Pseudaminobacter arsenicus]|uniref:XRE family transcriptional regulator n=1 Tax=Borborobacter arsenicus TaxID=1851146 RepID=A0A432UZI5_9HYPH|nr:helix-turn-helix domain-containing protein [Pseudaminobacter arsenicus]RUM95339.1 XRE family transcriptional regulator [Pseudaminobacter arsenicus]
MIESDSTEHATASITGEITKRRKLFFLTNLSVVLRADDDGMTFAVTGNKNSSRIIPYRRLQSAAVSNLFGRRRVLLYADTGVEAIRCHAPESKIQEFCDFINSRIVAAERKPIAARFSLTKTEVPREQQRLFSPHVDYRSALETLFDQGESTDDLLETLEKEISSLNTLKTTIKAAKHTKRASIPIVTSKEDGFSLFGNSNSYRLDIFLKDFNTKKAIVTGATIGVLSLSLWLLLNLPQMQPTIPEALSIPEQSTSSSEPELLSDVERPESRPRVLLHLITMMQDEEKYRFLIETLKLKRVAAGLDLGTLASRLGWETKKIEALESGAQRATPTEIIELTLAIKTDLIELTGFSQ